MSSKAQYLEAYNRNILDVYFHFKGSTVSFIKNKLIQRWIVHGKGGHIWMSLVPKFDLSFKGSVLES